MSVDQLESAIAVTGMACRFPGARTVDAFWRNLCEGASAIQSFDLPNLRREGVPETFLGHSSFIPVCAPIPDPYAFDAAYFGVSAATARLLDPQHRVFIEVVWAALEASGSFVADQPTIGLFAGCSDVTFPLAAEEQELGGALATSLGNSSDFFAARAAFLLNLTGPALTVRAACATSLVAVHLAVQSLLTNECDTAVAGGAAIRYPLQRGHIYEPGGIYSLDGTCRPYDSLASGIVSGDGAGAVVLRRLADAVADGNPIFAVIRGTAVTNDGARKSSFTAPTVEGQMEAALTALDVAGIDPSAVGYVEGHGTATPLGDPIEVEALRRAWSVGSRRSERCILGSVKSNIGHLDAAAGIAGLIKACLVVERGQIPGTLNYSLPNPHCNLQESPFFVSSATLPWVAEGPRYASVNSLGLGGTNVHVVLQEWQPVLASTHKMSRIPVVLPLSTRQPEAMVSYAEATATAVGAIEGDVAAVASTLQRGRASEPYRRTVVGHDRQQLTKRLNALTPPSRSAHAAPRLVLAFPADGKRMTATVAELAEHLPTVGATTAAAADHLHREWGVDLWEAIRTAEAFPRGVLAATLAQGAALHSALEQFGAGGDLVLGQSLGELTAAVAAGLISLNDGLDLAMARETAFRSIVPSGALAVGLSFEALKARLPPLLEISVVNAPQRCVVSGKPDALAAFAAELSAGDVPARPLDILSAVHCSLLDPALDNFRRAAERLFPRPPIRAILSGVGPVLLDEETAADPNHWVRQLRETVRFDTCLRSVPAADSTVILDVGSGGGLSAAIQETVGDKVRAVVQVAPNANDQSAFETFGHALGKLWEHGVDINWDAWPRRVAHRVRLPVPELARTIHVPVALTADNKAASVPSTNIGLWIPTWHRQAPIEDFGDAQRITILVGSDAFGPEVAASLAGLGHHVTTVSSVCLTQIEAGTDLIIDARALDEGPGPDSVANLIELTAALTQRNPAPPRLLLLTRGAYDILESERLVPAAAAVVAAGLVIAQEHRELTIGGVDLADEGCPNALARILPSLRSEGTWLGLRGMTLWRSSLEPTKLRRRNVTPLINGTCVITGGLGRFGRAVGVWLAEQGCRELFLVSRSGLVDGPAHDAVAVMRKAGAQVTVVAADVSDPTAFWPILDEIARAEDDLVTIFHLAGEPHALSAFAPITQLARGDAKASLREQWAGKVGGAIVLRDWMRRNSKARCVVFSSNAGTLGGPGLAAYAAANAAVDSLASSARGRDGLDWCAIGWDGWRLADGEAGYIRSALETFALHGMEPWVQLCEAVQTGQGRVSVAKGDLAERHRTWVEKRGATQISETNVAPTAITSAASVAGVVDVQLAVRAIWFDLVGPATDDYVDLFEAGGDSLCAMRIRSSIERSLNAVLTLQEVLENRTIAKLANIVRAKTQEPSQLPAAEPPLGGGQLVQGRL